MRNMRAIVFLFLSLSLSLSSFGQSTVAITGHVSDPSGTASTHVSMRAELTNTGGNQCRVGGSALVQPYVKDFAPTAGAWAFNLIPSSTITCGTTTGTSRWKFTVFTQAGPQSPCTLNITIATNLDSATCLNATGTIPATAPTSSLYCLLDASNCGFTAAPTAPGYKLNETTAPTGVVGVDVIYGDSTAHRPKVKDNNGAADTLALFTDNLSVFSATTSAQLAGVLSDESGTGVFCMTISCAMTTPNIGAATGTSLALGGGTALTTTNRTGTGNLVLATSPTLVTPVLGVASGTSLALGGGTALATTNQTGTGSIVLATSPSISDPTLTGNTLLKRIKATQGAALVTGDVGTLTGWGTTASVSAVLGTDGAGSITILSNGTGQTVNPTMTLTFHDGTWTNSPIVVATRTDTSGPVAVWQVISVTATAVAFQFNNGTPVAGSSYSLNFVAIGR